MKGGEFVRLVYLRTRRLPVLVVAYTHRIPPVFRSYFIWYASVTCESLNHGRVRRLDTSNDCACPRVRCRPTLEVALFASAQLQTRFNTSHDQAARQLPQQPEGVNEVGDVLFDELLDTSQRLTHPTCLRPRFFNPPLGTLLPPNLRTPPPIALWEALAMLAINSRSSCQPSWTGRTARTYPAPLRQEASLGQ